MNKMRNAFVTIVKNHNNRTEIFNGFSFVAHKLEGDHIFLYENGNNEEIKNKLSSYEKIYCTAICAGELIFIKKLIDKRWILGGPIFRLFSDDYLKKNLPEATIVRSSFEEFMNFKREDIFTPYWNDWLKWQSNISFLGYGANCGSNCYWGKCLFCRTTHNETDERNIKLIYPQLPEYKFQSFVHLRFGSTPPKDLKDLVDCIENNPKPNLIFRVYIRGDEDIKQVLERTKSLNNILFLVGLESLSQTTLDSINKGTNINTVLEIIKLISNKGGYCEVTLISRIPSPFIEQSLNESINTVNWIKKNIPINKNIFFYDAIDVEWPDEKVASMFGKYKIKNLNFGERYFFKEKVITSVLKEEDKKLYDIPITMLNEHGYTIQKRDYVERFSDA